MDFQTGNNGRFFSLFQVPDIETSSISDDDSLGTHDNNVKKSRRRKASVSSNISSSSQQLVYKIFIKHLHISTC